VIKRAVWKILLLIPYGLGSRMFDTHGGITILQTKHFRRALRNMSMSKELLSIDQSVQTLVRRHAVSTFLDRWRIQKLGAMSLDEYHRWVTVTNSDLFKSRQAQHTGVVLAACHIGMTRFLPLALAREGIDVATLEADAYYKNLKVPGVTSLESIDLKSANGFFLKALFRAKKILDHSGILLMAPDGLHGMGEGKKYPFLGKERTFYGGFAALAAKSGAAVIFPNLAVHADGRIEVEFSEGPLGIGESQEDIVDSLVGQYVSFVEDTWKTDLHKVTGPHLTFFHSL
jgi:lauroyl/myristoyl acyltransferase